MKRGLLSFIWCAVTTWAGCLGGPGVEPPAEPPRDNSVSHIDSGTAMQVSAGGTTGGATSTPTTTQVFGAGGTGGRQEATGIGGASAVKGQGGTAVPADTNGPSVDAGVTGASGATGAPGAAGATGGAGGAKAGAAGGTAGGSAGAGGAAGKGGTSGAGGTGTKPKRPCLKDPDQVVLIGDSYITWISHAFPNDLAAASGEIYPAYRNYAVAGYAMASGGLGLIPPQFDQALTDDPDIVAAVVSGGGNDVLSADTNQYRDGDACKNDPNSPNIADCQAIAQRALDAFVALLDRMANAGVKDVVYFAYPRVPAPTILGGRSPNEIVDYARPKYKAACEGVTARTGGKLNCYFLDLVTVLDNKDGTPIMSLFAAGDIHPNTLGSTRMAEAVWAIMKKNCVAQRVSSGCCAP